MKFVLLAAWIFSAGLFPSRAENNESGISPDRYRAIVERHPFGRAAPPPEPASDTPTTAPAPFRLSALMEMDCGTRAGLVGLHGQRPLHLQIGQSEEGVTLLSVDMEKQEARIRKDGQVYELKIEASAEGSAAPRPPAIPGHPRLAPMGDAAAQERMRILMERRKQIIERMRQQRDAAPP